MARGAAERTGPHRLAIGAKHARAVELRIMGWTFEQIAAELGFRSRGAACEAVKAHLAKRDKPLADELAKIHMAQLEAAIRPVMDQVEAHISGRRRMSAKQAGVVTLALTRNLAAQAKYVDVYSGSQGIGPVANLLERLLSSPPEGIDPDDPMTATAHDDPALNTDG